MHLFDANIITLHPELFPGPLTTSLAGKALKNKIWSLETYNLHSFSYNKRQSVDDRPFGGGSGMLISPEILAKAIDHIQVSKKIDKIIYFSPRGKVIKQKDIYNLAHFKYYIFICGRFEGIDERVIEEYNVEEYSLGDFVLSGGDIACMAMIDAYVRLLPTVLESQALDEESFSNTCNYENLLEYPQYTRPALWRGRQVPQILTSGNHKKIKEWKLNKAIEDTKIRRPDLQIKNKI